MISLLQLPLEARWLIYDYLTPSRNLLDDQIQLVSFAACNRWPPKLDLLLVHHQLTKEVLEHFAARTTWTMFLPAIDNGLWTFYESKQIKRPGICILIRDVNIVIFSCGEYSGAAEFESQISAYVKHACELLRKSALKRLGIGSIELHDAEHCDKQPRLPPPLRMLAKDAVIQPTDYSWPATIEARKAYEEAFSQV